MKRPGYIALWSLIVLCVFSACESTDPDSPAEDVELHPDLEYFPDEFEVVLMRGNATDPPVEGNSLDAFEAAHAQGIRFVEVDFRVSQDGYLIATHPDALGGDCGRASQSTLAELRECRLDGDRRIATLEDLLEFPFESIYIDLKASSGATAEELFEMVETAVDAIIDADRRQDSVLMLYDIDDDVAELIAELEIRGSLKGYPSDPESVTAMIDETASYGLEMMCINAANLSPELVEYSMSQAVWQLPWDHTREANIPHWETLSAAGIGGIIVDTDAIVPHSVIDAWPY